MTSAQPAEAATVLRIHERLEAHYDIDRWHWKDETQALEICLGSILVQHTAWANVEKALLNLVDAGVGTPEVLVAMPEDELALLVRPVGTPLTKARRLQTFARLVLDHGGFASLFGLQDDKLRRLLLATHGIGPETADVIMLYGARKPAIVHDAYTARLFRRYGLGPEDGRYDVWRAWLDVLLPRDVEYRKRHHAAIVVHCKETCRVRPKCSVCPLRSDCAYAMVVAAG